MTLDIPILQNILHISVMHRASVALRGGWVFCICVCVLGIFTRTLDMDADPPHRSHTAHPADRVKRHECRFAPDTPPMFALPLRTHKARLDLAVARTNTTPHYTQIHTAHTYTTPRELALGVCAMHGARARIRDTCRQRARRWRVIQFVLLSSSSKHCALGVLCVRAERNLHADTKSTIESNIALCTHTPVERALQICVCFNEFTLCRHFN